jgi:hypothetical protein
LPATRSRPTAVSRGHWWPQRMPFPECTRFPGRALQDGRRSPRTNPSWPLSAAAGSLELAQLADVLVRRFPAAVEAADAALDEGAFDRVAAPARDRPDVVVECSERAREVYEQLSPSQRALLPHLDKPIGDRAQVLGVGRSQAYAASGKLSALLAELVLDDELREEVTMEVLRLCVVSP